MFSISVSSVLLASLQPKTLRKSDGLLFMFSIDLILF